MTVIDCFEEDRATRTRCCDGTSQPQCCSEERGFVPNIPEYGRSTSFAGLWSERPERTPPSTSWC